MFHCANCGTNASDAERGSVGVLGNIGFLFVAKVPWWPSDVCKKCSRQVRLFGAICLVVVVNSRRAAAPGSRDSWELGREHSRDLPSQFRNQLVRRVPDDLPVQPEVLVHDDVSE